MLGYPSIEPLENIFKWHCAVAMESMYLHTIVFIVAFLHTC